MNIFVIRYVNKDHGTDWKSLVLKESSKEAKEHAKGMCNQWDDGTTFEVIEYTPLQK